MATSSGDAYAFGDNPAIQALFNNRQAHIELEFLLPFLKPGVRVVDLGCGAGSMTCDIAAIVAPAPVIGLDSSEPAIAGARNLARTRDLTNVTFQVGSVYDTGLPGGAFDVAVMSVVLSYLAEPTRAALEAHRLLAPGGVIGARDMVAEGAEGGWYAGPYAEARAKLSRALRRNVESSGGDPSFGKRLKIILAQAGFTDVAGRPSYSEALSSPTNMLRALGGFLESPGVVRELIAEGIASDAERTELHRQLEVWAQDASSINAVAEYQAWGKKQFT